MKHIVIAIPGAADHPAEELGGKTPLEVSKVPNLNYFTKSGTLGFVKLAPEKREPSGDTTFLNLLGYDADKCFTGRGPLEAANLELKLEDNEILVDKPIIRNSPDRGKVRIRQVVDDTGKPSKTLFRVVRSNHDLTLAEVKTYSGRTHQIRCHAEYIGQLPEFV